MDGGLGGPQSGVFNAIADLAKDVGMVQAQVAEKVSFQQLMNRDTEARRELGSRLDNMEAHVTSSMNLALQTINSKIESLSQAIAKVEAPSVMVQQPPPRATRDIVTASIGIAIAIIGIYLLKQAGVEMPI